MQHQVANLAGSLDGQPPILAGAAVEGPNSFAATGTVRHAPVRGQRPGQYPVRLVQRAARRVRRQRAVLSTVEPAIDLTALTPLAFAWQDHQDNDGSGQSLLRRTAAASEQARSPRGPDGYLEPAKWSRMTAMEDGSGGTPRRRVGVLVAVALLVYAADVISKAIVVATLTENVPVRLAGSLLQLDHLRNPGPLSRWAHGYTVVFTLIAAAVIVAILRIARTLASGHSAVALGLLLGGALGNLTTGRPQPRPLRGWVVDSSSCRTGRSSTWPTRRSAVEAR